MAAAPLGVPGVQLYTVREDMQADVRGTLGRVAQIGYKEVEFAGYFGLDPETIKGWLEEFDLAAPSSHVGYDQWKEDAAAVIGTAVEVGHEYVLVPGLPDDRRGSLDDYRFLAEEFNGYGEACQAAGIKFAFHNHDYEFRPIDGVIPFDILASETDPSFVNFEMDLFWTVTAGQQPVKYFEKYPGRFKMCHVKDMAADGSMVDVGAGQIDFAGIFAHAKIAGLKHFYVEHDDPDDGFASIEASLPVLRSLLG